ncbi:hypothetical protein EV679_3360 [Kerstersia gyiorum]|jgi:hypothetical protein|uniref:Uncharacterized protein n=1 Tax=Kerstersia gyiorum TaxID=206506 RepID=A0A4Q7MA03_9BURK|nr:hypothetical protein [Kerstersia gyiorum]MCP1637227.1 hypothetical protein [Kerstersia gyiorum]MCP1672191.1 hypothetical protein [Kerstersia gyiorum]MCP1679685.1 hypothetical protein [Kerstersia gyiorum]MCP1682752.1 hypothetical protein [Kerstersia gyiorum]
MKKAPILAEGGLESNHPPEAGWNQKFNARLSTASAASFMASDRVG